MSEYTKEDFLVSCKNQFEESKNALIKHLDFTEDGLRQVYRDYPTEVGPVFTQFIGEPFTGEDRQYTIVIEKAFSSPESLAEMMYLMYGIRKREEDQSKQSEQSSTGEKDMVATQEENAEVTAQRATKLEGGSRGRKKIDWSKEEIPFTEGTKSYFVLKQMKDFNGTVEEFKKHILSFLEERGLHTKNIETLISGVMLDVKTKNWGSIKVEGGKYVVVRGC